MSETLMSTSLEFTSAPLPSSPRVLFMGTPDFAVPALRALHAWCEQRGGVVVGVVSQPDRPKGRGKQLARTPIASLADELGLTCYQWPKLSQASYDTLTDLKYDLAVVIAYGKILPKRYLTLPPWGCVNLHASLLPAYRGAAPIQWALIEGETETGVSVMRLDEGMDTGPVAHMLTLPIEPQATSLTLFTELATLSAQALTEVLNRWVDPEADDPVTFVEQNHDLASHAAMLSKADGVLHWSEPAPRLLDRLRGVTPWPGAQVKIAEGTLKVLEAEAWSEAETEEVLQQAPEELRDNAPPGTVVAKLPSGPLIRCGNGALLLTRVQRPSKKATSGGDFHRGYSLELGELLSSC